MAPRIPYYEKKKISGEDKFEAAVIALFILLIGVGVILGVGAALVSLWQAGLTNLVVIIGIFSGLFAIGRALYLTILKEYN